MIRREASRTIALDRSSDERRSLTLLALFVLAVMLLPAPSGAQVARPTAGGAEGEVVAEPTPEPTAEPTAEPMAVAPVIPQPTEGVNALGALVDEPEEETPEEEQIADDPADDGSAAEVPTPPSSEDQGPAEVQAEGAEAEEVAAPPVPEGEAEAAPPADPAAEAAAETTLEPAPVTVTYGTSSVPSLGTAARPLTTDGLASPMVLVPMVAGAERSGSPVTSVPVSPNTALQTLASPVRGVAAGGLAGVQPSAAAVVSALLMVLIAAAYGAVLRQRGEEVPVTLRVSDAIRPSDRTVTAARSVRPADLGRSARSIRP